MYNYEIRKLLRRAKTKVRVGAFYYHYKNPKKIYRVEKLAINEADSTVVVVVYSAHDNDDEITWVRPIDSFLENVGNVQSRFTRFE